MSRCIRCDGVGCMECIPEMADFRISQRISGRATRALMESLRVCCGQPDTCERDCPSFADAGTALGSSQSSEATAQERAGEPTNGDAEMTEGEKLDEVLDSLEWGHL